MSKVTTQLCSYPWVPYVPHNLRTSLGKEITYCDSVLLKWDVDENRDGLTVGQGGLDTGTHIDRKDVRGQINISEAKNTKTTLAISDG